MSINKIKENRSIILTQLDTDRFKEEESTINVNELSKTKGLFVSNNNTNLELDESKWNYDYWTKMCVELSNNFSTEKLKHVIQVAKTQRKKGDSKFMPAKKVRKVSSKNPTEREKTTRNYDGYFDK